MKLLCDQVADDFLKNQETSSRPDTAYEGLDNKSRKLIRSRPYVRKNNLIIDKSINFAWETCLRFNTFDLYVTILRRSYIPPFMDMYQDIIVCSRFGLTPDWGENSY